MHPTYRHLPLALLTLATFFGVKGATPSTVTLTCSPNPSIYGRVVTLTATLTAGATGSVTFYDGVVVLGTGSVAGGSASLSTPSLPAGGHRLTAYYRGDSNFAASISAVLAHIVQAVGGNVLAATAYAPGQNVFPYGFGVADFSGSGKPDLLWEGVAGAGILPGNGDGTFQALRTIASQTGSPGAAHAFAIADFNGDGKLDVALAQQSPSAVAILLGNGDGTFQAGPTLNVAAIPISVAAGDLNGDGNVDLVVADEHNVSIYLGTGDGNFLPPVVCVTGTFVMQVAVGDFNGDGKADLVVVDSVVNGTGGIKVLLGYGDGTFQAPVLLNAVQADGLVVADFDQDGLDDIAVVIGADVEILMGTRDGQMRSNGFTGLPDYANALLVPGDFNGDGKIDLVAGMQSGGIVVLPGNGDGTFGAEIEYPTAPYPTAIVVGDFNGDGRPDIVVGGSPGFSVLYGASGVVTASGTPQSAFLGTSFASPLAVTIEDTNGNPISGVTVNYFNGQPGAAAVLSGTAAVTNAAGVASITATANNTAGAYMVWASAGTLTAMFDLSNNADAPASLTSLSGTPQSAAAGMAFPAPLKVVLKDSAGKPVTGATISFSTPTAILLSSATVATDASGQAQVFAKAANTPGPYSVVASSGALSEPFTLTVLAPVAVSLSTSPNPSIYGQPVTLTAAVPPGVSGKVTFYDGLVVLGTATIAGQSASRFSILLPSGARKVTALYSGDTGHPASRSNVVAQTVFPTPNSSFNFGSAALIGGTYAPGYGPLAGVIGDFNGDGIADLAIANATAKGQGSVIVLLGNGDGTFRSPINSPNVGEAWALASGDFNGDGVADLAVAVNGVGVVILLGNGDGSMRLGTTYALGKPAALAVTDLNGDGRVDLAVLDWSNATLAVLLGNGDGTFQQPVTYDAGGSYPTSLVVADFNGDGTPDFALVSGINAVAVSIFLGNPDGTLQPLQQQLTGTVNIGSVAAGDFNGDGRVDLIVVGSLGWQVLLSNGDGTFRQLAWNEYPTWTSSPVVADFNGDGQLDVALLYGSSGGQGVMFLFGQGDGTFATPVTYAGTSSYLPLGCGAFTGQGKANLALLDTATRSVLLLRDPAPGLVISSTHASNVWQGVIGASYVLTVTNNQATTTVGAIAVTDTLPDGLTAIAISGSGWNCDLPTLTCTRPDSLAPGDSYPSIVLTFDVAANAPAEVVNSAAVSVGGVNSATTSDPTSISQTLYPTTTMLTVSPSPANLGQSVTLTAQLPSTAPTGGTVVFYDGASILGRGSISSFPGLASIATNALPSGTRLLHAYFMGNGPFGPSTSPTVSLTVQSGSSQGFSPLGGYAVTGNAYSIVAGDFNRDGNADLAIANGSGFSVLLGSGQATFQPPVNYTANKASTFVATGDFNGDGKPDLVTANPFSNDVTVFLGNGDGTFQTGVSYPVGMAPYSIAIGDLNGDGIADLAVPNSGSNSVTILLGKGDGTFQTFVSYPVPAGAYSVAIADFNGDSKPDLAVTSSSGSVTILLGNGNGIFQSPVTVPVGGSPVAIAAADFNGDGKVDLVVANGNNNISVLLGKGNGSFQAAVSYAAGANPSALAVGDFNGDGKLDIAVGSGSGGGVSVLLGNGDGTFGAATVYASGSEVTSLAVGDFAGDGKSDLAVTTGNSAFTIPNAVSRPSNRTMKASGATNVLILDAVDSTGVPTCYVNGNLAVSVSNVQLIVNQALGVAPAVDDLNGDGVVNVIDVQIINAALGLGCAAK